MENQTYITEFHLVLFASNANYALSVAGVFFILYIFGIFNNSVIIAVIYVDNQLHTPMYLFLCNLALVDICYTTTTVPNLLYMLLSGDNTVSFIQCFTQMYFYFLAASTEDILIFVMAYDRYVAICNPLRYHYILSRKKCLLLAFGTWVVGCLNSLVFVVPVSHMSFCHSNTIHQFLCDAKALVSIACGGNFDIGIYLELLIFGFFPPFFCLLSYIKIIRVILQIKSKEGRIKAISTCSSHLTVVAIYFTTVLTVFIMPPSKYSNVLEPFFAVLYSVITPMLNPIIYSLRNKDVKRALLKILGVGI